MSESDGGCGGCGFVGGLLAAALSWTTFKSIGWAIVAFCFSWLYVAYYLIEYGAEALWRLF